MDLQSYVEQRIRELESGQTPATVDRRDRRRLKREKSLSAIEASGVAGCGVGNDESKAGEHRRRRFDPGNNLEDFCEMIDAALVEIAGRVMEIAEGVTEDNARLEKELMDSRLTALESAESVMDMALSIRKKARQIMTDNGSSVSSLPNPGKRGFTADCEKVVSAAPTTADENRPEAGERASMHAVGVAALFRKTH